ncbi:protoporphyrin IX magnesium-chelatase [Loktanella fryxellensis]|uniref:Protoporphyrin IX magnesium-chelatase n=1 Tax=Loktanella fryxellensis TaxID=245187 RepID=A0A1H8CRT8_9RHOB|nr:magnesium chelatase subunit D [Loktanella fryxellensis]SEM96847.1 protoporphyrin IX magnesium-chelatase [Loktanella fryxellensis]
MADVATPDPWGNALLALRLLAIDPGLGGLCIRARSGPVRDALPLPEAVRLHPAMGDDALFGGLDLTATLAAGRVVQRGGLLDRDGPLLLSMAERCARDMAAKLALHLDGTRRALILLDEGTEDQAPPATLTERLAFHVDLTDVAMAVAVVPPPAPLPTVANITTAPGRIAQIVAATEAFGIDSARAPTFALRAARAHAALMGRAAVTDDDISVACALTLAHRATRIPAPPEPEVEEQPDDAPPPDQDGADDNTTPENDSLQIPDELLLEAVRALIPDDLLARLAAQKARSGKGDGTGAARLGNRRGRPLPSRAGRLQDGARIDIAATLRTAAPWQTIRRAETGRIGLHIRTGDIQIRRFAETSDRVLIFAVDASGSAALARLAEAKGAVEILLTQAYARRDHVALIAFRGTDAETLLPPTRSLVQTKRRLAALPGGGGTPLAAGLDAALALGVQAKRRGMTPTLCLLTDGRANIARDGQPDRARAATDAQAAARLIRASGMDALVIDTGNRPSDALRQLASTLAAPYLPMPRADAARLSQAVGAALVP